MTQSDLVIENVSNVSTIQHKKDVLKVSTGSEDGHIDLIIGIDGENRMKLFKQRVISMCQPVQMNFTLLSLERYRMLLNRRRRVLPPCRVCGGVTSWWPRLVSSL